METASEKLAFKQISREEWYKTSMEVCVIDPNEYI